ncbi:MULTISPECIES: LpxL/LpxP family Kdo(2)-lipid IV(A) lauroyl/palmitoleoyl acyltransferase [unclassified Oleiphilus]|uniref:LpxL/LpxP family Kdo(2)-lipid IV(A) lauroyl/palmitoleoyl acyltransferase n=1 Tax=unclassified Oleiphilus TaxID=2631174 RepID=UPI000ADD07AB|nr:MULTISPECIES: LpxL/LpxP family Kdo(2)-lipid IV(A) lauroyl/palmitoleoyl acyltransferase [unclassified Oleiphilus]
MRFFPSNYGVIVGVTVQKIDAPKFELRFLGPRFWLVWLGFIFLFLLTCLPYRVVRFVGAGLGKIMALLGKKRIAIARRNLELCFPHLSEKQREQLLSDNIAASGMAVLETVMGWWWPDWRVKRLVTFEGFEHIAAIRKRGKGIFGIAIHCLSLEFACRALGFKQPCVAFYRKHNNDLMEYLQYHGRARSNKYMINKRDVKGMFQALDDGELTLYLPDQDYGLNRSIFVPFFDVAETATTTGPIMFMRNSDCEAVFIQSISSPNGYTIKITPGIDGFPSGDDRQDMTKLNSKVEDMIMLAPEQYLWMHKRFKTRPNPEDDSLYRDLK